MHSPVGAFPGKFLFDGLVHLPLVLPPVVTGYVLLLLFGRKGPIGAFLDSHFGIVFSFRWTGAALAAAVMGFPLLVRAIRLSFEAADRRLEDAARTLGANRLIVFFTIVMPLALPGSSQGSFSPSPKRSASSAPPSHSYRTFPVKRAHCPLQFTLIRRCPAEMQMRHGSRQWRSFCRSPL